MKTERYDLLVRTGRLICPNSGRDEAGAVAVRGECISAVGPGLQGFSVLTRDFPNGLLLPGLVYQSSESIPTRSSCRGV